MTSNIRLAAAPDADAVAAIYRPVVVGTPTSFEVDPPDGAELRRRIEATLSRYPWLVCERDGAILGYAYASQHRVRSGYQWSVDTSVYVHADARRGGVGRGLYTSLFRILSALGYVNAFAGIALPNPGSVGLHEAVGFRRIGVYRHVGFKLGAWHDVGWWQLALAPALQPPGPLRTPADLTRDPAWPSLVRAGEALVRPV